MPHEWLDDSDLKDGQLAELHLWPFRSLPKRGFVWFVGGTFALLSLPLIAVAGSPVLWGLLPFILGAVWLLWYMLERSYKDGELLEEFRVWPNRLTLTQHHPRRKPQSWEANPYWVSLHMHPKTGPVENYITLKGNGREVEIGAFLSPEERAVLYSELQDALKRARETHDVGPGIG